MIINGTMNSFVRVFWTNGQGEFLEDLVTRNTAGSRGTHVFKFTFLNRLSCK